MPARDVQCECDVTSKSDVSGPCLSFLEVILRLLRQNSVIFMPPTSKKLRGHIGLGLSV